MPARTRTAGARANAEPMPEPMPRVVARVDARAGARATQPEPIVRWQEPVPKPMASACNLFTIYASANQASINGTELGQGPKASTSRNARSRQGHGYGRHAAPWLASTLSLTEGFNSGAREAATSSTDYDRSKQRRVLESRAMIGAGRGKKYIGPALSSTGYYELVLLTR